MRSGPLNPEGRREWTAFAVRGAVVLALVLASGCADSDQKKLTGSDRDAIIALVKRETGHTRFELVENAPCNQPCSASRRRAARYSLPFENPLESCGTLAVIREGNSVTILQLERSWRGWGTCVRTERDVGEDPALGPGFPWEYGPGFQ